MTAPRFVILAMLLALVPVASPARAQTEPMLDRLQQSLTREWLTAGFLIQVVGDFQPERSRAGENGFSLGTVRVRARGRLDRGFRYFVQGALERSPTVLDARISYELDERWILDAGAFKSPFGGEFQTPVDAIDFVNRARVVSALAPGRQIGVDVRGRIAEDTHLRAGLFNGNGLRASGNDGDGFLFASRLDHIATRRGAGERRHTELGLSFAASRDDNVTTGPFASFGGDRLLLGADARLERGRSLLAGEVIWGALDPDPGARIEPWGYHLTAGRSLGERSQALVRLEGYDPGVVDMATFLILGYNHWPTGATELQLNAVFPLDEALENVQFLLNLQIGI